MGAKPKDRVRRRIDDLAPCAALGHRGTGPTRTGHPFPENSISSFRAALDQGADGIELDVEITGDGKLIVMHDDTLDRTTDGAGCVSGMSLARVRRCLLLDGDGAVTTEAPPTLAEVYAAIGKDALINVELKVFEAPCATPSTGSDALVTAVLAEVDRIGGANRTILSSFDEATLEIIKTRKPDYYCALISETPQVGLVDRASSLGLDAIHFFATVSETMVRRARDRGLQVGIWTLNAPASMQAAIDRGATAILTDQPRVLAQILGR